jgi:hypothetical protein
MRCNLSEVREKSRVYRKIPLTLINGIVIYWLSWSYRPPKETRLISGFFVGLRFQPLMLRLARGFSAHPRVFVSLEALPAHRADVLDFASEGLEGGAGVSKAAGHAATRRVTAVIWPASLRIAVGPVSGA